VSCSEAGEVGQQADTVASEWLNHMFFTSLVVAFVGSRDARNLILDFVEIGVLRA
jgi:hypothetical protein